MNATKVLMNQCERECVWRLRPAWLVTGCICAVLFPVMLLRWGRKTFFKTPSHRDVTVFQHKALIASPWVHVCVFRPKVKVEAMVNTHSAALLTAMMNHVPKCVYECVCAAVDLKLQP